MRFANRFRRTGLLGRSGTFRRRVVWSPGQSDFERQTRVMVVLSGIDNYGEDELREASRGSNVLEKNSRG